MIIVFLIICITPFNDVAKRFTKPDSTALARIPFTIIGTKILLANPSGIVGEELKKLKREHIKSFKNFERTINMPIGTSYLELSAFHNCLLNIGIKHGWLVLIGYLLLYLYIFRLNYRALKNSTIGSADYYFYSGVIAYFCAYIIQSFSHNTGLTTGDPYDWITIGVILAYKPSQINSDECSKNDEKI